MLLHSLWNRFSFAILRSIGATLILLPVVFFAFTIGPAVKEEVKYFFTFRKKTQIAKVEAAVWNNEKEHIDVATTLAVQKQAQELGVDSTFSIVVPKISAAAKIIPNVDTNDEKEYLEALKEGVAHAKGTHFPGEGKTIYLFSHSTNSAWMAARMDAVFYLLNKIKKDDSVTIFFADKRYDYKVVDTKVVEASDTSWTTYQLGGGETLILQTCTPPGTSWKRLLVIAKPRSIFIQ